MKVVTLRVGEGIRIVPEVLVVCTQVGSRVIWLDVAHQDSKRTICMVHGDKRWIAPGVTMDFNVVKGNRRVAIDAPNLSITIIHRTSTKESDLG